MIKKKKYLPTEETRLKMSVAHKNIKQSQEWIDDRIAKAGSEEAKKYGKVKTKKEKKVLSENSAKFWQGKTRDQETKDKISKTKKEQGLLPSNIRKVAKVDLLTGKVLETYNSTTEAARQNPGYSQSKISRLCNGVSKNSRTKDGIIWRFA